MKLPYWTSYSVVLGKRRDNGKLAVVWLEDRKRENDYVFSVDDEKEGIELARLISKPLKGETHDE